MYRIIDTPYGKIYLTHGHKELAFNLLISNAKKHGCKMVIHGHTHKCTLYMQDGILVLCPGSLRFPRGGDGRSYAIITIDEIYKEVKVEFLKI